MQDSQGGAYSDATRLLLLTLTRREMVLGARASELVDLDGAAPRWVVPAERTKSGRDHVVPLSPAAVDVFRARLDAAKGEILFPAVGHDVRAEHMTWSSRYVLELRAAVVEALTGRKLRPAKKADQERRARQKETDRLKRAAVKASGVPRWTIHHLRHTAATHLREDLQVDRETVRLLLGHTAPGVTSIYDRAEMLQERRSALAAWDGWLSALRADRPVAARQRDGAGNVAKVGQRRALARVEASSATR